MIKLRKGSTLLSTIIISLIAIVFVTIIVANILNIVNPLIMQEKLNKISDKYMFVIEKFGYLTSSEKNKLINDLKSDSFDINKITIYYPQNKKNYGEIINFTLIYKMEINKLSFEFGKLKILKDTIEVKTSKFSYSKI